MWHERLAIKLLLLSLAIFSVSTAAHAELCVIGYEYVVSAHEDNRKSDYTMIHHKLIIDRFEGSWAVVEYNGEIFDIPRSLLPPEAKAGDTLTVSFRMDHEDTAERRKRIEKLMDDLFL